MATTPIFDSILHALNPVSQLGRRSYYITFPILSTVLLSASIELYAVYVLHDPDSVGMPAIVILLGSIVYFAFRNGIRGGIAATLVTILYYAYIITTHDAPVQDRRVQWQTVLVLAFLYTLIATIIGGLKQVIDQLIEQEANERRRLQTIVQQLPVGVIVTDKLAHVVLANKNAELMLGKKITEHMIIDNKFWIESTFPVITTLATGKPVVAQEYTVNRYGRKKYIQVSATAVHNMSGKIIAAATIINDISHQKELEKRKDDFINIASHELKTPITSMKLFVDILADRLVKLNDDRSVRTLDRIRHQTERLQSLIGDLIDVSRLQTGKMSFTKKEFRLDRLIEETINGLKGTTKQQFIRYTPDVPIFVNADKFRISQVITNFLTNAIKYSPPKKDITVFSRVDNNHVTVSVRDEGIGITKAQHKKIFHRLYQVTGSTEKTFPGLGMGLYISREIIRKHKGKIGVLSRKGKGSTFYFTLPVTTP